MPSVFSFLFPDKKVLDIFVRENEIFIVIDTKTAYNNEIKEALKTMHGLGESLENRGFEKGKLIQLVELVDSGDLSVEKASQKAGMSIEAFEKKIQELLVTV